MLNLLVRKATKRWHDVYIKAQKNCFEAPMSIYCQYSFMQTPSQNPFFYGVDDAETYSKTVYPIKKFLSRHDPHPMTTSLRSKDLEVPKSPKWNCIIS